MLSKERPFGPSCAGWYTNWGWSKLEKRRLPRSKLRQITLILKNISGVVVSESPLEASWIVHYAIPGLRCYL